MTSATRPTIKALVVQNGPAHESTTDNVAELIGLIREHAADFKPDCILMSELATTAYFAGYNDPKYFHLAEPVDGPSVTAFADLARELGSYVLVPFFEKGPVKGEFYNSVAVLDRDGDLVRGDLPGGGSVSCYRKCHIPDQYSYAPGLNERYYFRAGPGLPTFDLDFGRTGVLICYERSFPEAWRVLSLRGAEIVFVPVALYGPNRAASWSFELRTAAVQNGVFVVASNKGGVETTDADRQHHGESLIISPLGDVLAEGPIGTGPAVITATLDLSVVDDHSVRYTFFRDRRPDLYAPISSDVARDVL